MFCFFDKNIPNITIIMAIKNVAGVVLGEF